MFAISNKTDYGLLLLSQLAKKDTFVPMSQLTANTNLPERFIARIASDMVRYGILQSREGKVGGYRLARKLNQITLTEFFSLFEEKTDPVKCLKPEYECKFDGLCTHKTFFRSKLGDILKTELSKWTVADLFESGDIVIPDPDYAEDSR